MTDLEREYDEIMQSLDVLAEQWLEAKAAGQVGIASAIDVKIKLADKTSRKLERKIRHARRKQVASN